MENKIREFRKAKGMSQTELSEKLGVSQQTLSSWETGQNEPLTFNAICLAKLLGTTVEELFGP